MKYFCAGLGTTIVVVYAAANIEIFLSNPHPSIIAPSICCGLVIGLGWKLLDELRELKNRLANKADDDDKEGGQ